MIFNIIYIIRKSCSEGCSLTFLSRRASPIYSHSNSANSQINSRCSVGNMDVNLGTLAAIIVPWWNDAATTHKLRII